MTADLLAPVSAGELLDKIAILRIKRARIADPAKLANVRQELAALEEVAARAIPRSPDLAPLEAELRAVNEALWEIEDDIRAHDARGDFGPGFVRLAQAVYRTNDRRAALKREVNRLTGSRLVEEKSYHDHAGPAAPAALPDDAPPDAAPGRGVAEYGAPATFPPDSIR